MPLESSYLYRTTKKNEIRLRNFLLATVLLLSVDFIYVKVNSFHYYGHLENTNYFKLLTYNLYFKNNYKKNSYNLIKNENADIVCFQEYTVSWHHFFSSQTKYKYNINKPKKGTHGLAIKSKYPIKLIKYLYNSNHLPFAQIIVMTKNNKKILICNTHLASPAKAVENPDHFIQYYIENYKLRKKQYNAIQEYINSVKTNYDSFIYAGDLNTTELEPLYRDFTFDWENTSTKFLEFSFPNSQKFPKLVNLDYILIQGNLKLKSYKVLKGGSSDHLAIASELYL